MSKLTKEGRAKLTKAREADPAAVAVKFQPAETEAVTVTGKIVPVLEIPDPQDPETDDDTLTDAEQKRLATYEAVLDRHRNAFWEDGKVLEGIIRGKLHRGQGYPSVEAYLDDRWGISRTVAYRRIELWRIGERLSPMGDRFNERQARVLKPYSDRHGLDAAETVYRTIVETEGVKVTARLVEDAVGVLPEGKYNEKKTVEIVRAFLAGEMKPAIPGPAPGVQANPGELVDKFRKAIRSINVKEFRDIPSGARLEVAKELRALADEIAPE